MKLKRIDFAFLIIFIVLTIISIDLLLNESHQKTIENISKYEPFQNLVSAFLITFWVCVIGNLLPFPTPYTWVVCYSCQPFIINLYIPLLMAFVASLGCLVGEIAGYIVGRGTAEIISEDKIENLNILHKSIINHPKLAPILIFLAALTPISDDFIMIPLGILKYSPKKTIFWCWLGKFGMMLIFAYNLFNICNLIGGESWIISIISLYIIIIIIFLMLRFNMVKILQRIDLFYKNKANKSK